MTTTSKTELEITFDKPDRPGLWSYSPDGVVPWIIVLVEWSPAGIFCKQLGMGGGILHGYNSWSGRWKKQWANITEG